VGIERRAVGREASKEQIRVEKQGRPEVRAKHR